MVEDPGPHVVYNAGFFHFLLAFSPKIKRYNERKREDLGHVEN